MCAEICTRELPSLGSKAMVAPPKLKSTRTKRIPTSETVSFTGQLVPVLAEKLASLSILWGRRQKGLVVNRVQEQKRWLQSLHCHSNPSAWMPAHTSCQWHHVIRGLKQIGGSDSFTISHHRYSSIYDPIHSTQASSSMQYEHNQ